MGIHKYRGRPFECSRHICAPLAEATLHWAVRRLFIPDLLSCVYFISVDFSAHVFVNDRITFVNTNFVLTNKFQEAQHGHEIKYTIRERVLPPFLASRYTSVSDFFLKRTSQFHYFLGSTNFPVRTGHCLIDVSFLAGWYNWLPSTVQQHSFANAVRNPARLLVSSVYMQLRRRPLYSAQSNVKAGDTLSSRHVSSHHVLRFIFNSFPISYHALALTCWSL
jgi:hypothetical protein